MAAAGKQVGSKNPSFLPVCPLFFARHAVKTSAFVVWLRLLLKKRTAAIGDLLPTAYVPIERALNVKP